MSNANPSGIGQVNNAGASDALFLKQFSGEVLTSFEQATVTADKQMVRTIANGKSAQFPVMGRSSASYHTPGTEITGTDVNHNEKVITINDLLLSSHFISNIEEAKNHYDVRSVYSTEMGRALAFQMDKHVLQTMLQAAGASANVGDSGYAAGTTLTNTSIASATAATAADALIESIFDAAESLDNNYVPSEGRFCFLKPDDYYKLANASKAVNVDFSGQGSIASGNVLQIAGITLVKTPHLPTSNIAYDASAPATEDGTAGRQAVNATNTSAIVSHTSAVGTVKLMDLAVESEYDIRRQGTLMVAKYAMGHGVLRPEAAVRINKA